MVAHFLFNEIEKFLFVLMNISILWNQFNNLIASFSGSNQFYFNPL